MITREELMLIKGRVGVLKPHHQRIRALSENAYRLLAHDMPLIIAELEWRMKEDQPSATPRAAATSETMASST